MPLVECNRKWSGGFGVLTKIARLPKRIVSFAQKAVAELPAVTAGYAYWVIVSIYGLKTYFDLPYRRLLVVLYEIPTISRIVGQKPLELTDFTPVCSRMQNLKMPLWRAFLRLSAEPHYVPGVLNISALLLRKLFKNRWRFFELPTG